MVDFSWDSKRGAFDCVGNCNEWIAFLVVFCVSIAVSCPCSIGAAFSCLISSAEYLVLWSGCARLCMGKRRGGCTEKSSIKLAMDWSRFESRIAIFFVYGCASDWLLDWTIARRPALHIGSTLFGATTIEVAAISHQKNLILG